MKLKELLTSCRRMAKFLSEYSCGNIQEQALRMIKEIDKYLEEEELYS